MPIVLVASILDFTDNISKMARNLRPDIEDSMQMFLHELYAYNLYLWIVVGDKSPFAFYELP